MPKKGLDAALLLDRLSFFSSVINSPQRTIMTSFKIVSNLALIRFMESVRIRSFSGMYSVRLRENTDQKNSE